MGQQQSHQLDPAQVERLRAKYGAKVDAVLLEAAQIFGGLDVSTDGVLNRSEFSKSLGIMGTSNSVLSNFIFDAIDTDRNNELSFAEFVEFLLTVSIGTRDDKLDFGFRLMDLDKNGVITKEEIVTMISMFIQVLSSFQLMPPKKDSFVDDLWKLFDFDSDGAITQEEYRRGCLAHPELISQLGLGRKSEQASAKIGKRVLMGQHKWDFMLSVMIGIHVRCVGATPGGHRGVPTAYRDPRHARCRAWEQRSLTQTAIEGIAAPPRTSFEQADFESKEEIQLPAAQRRVIFQVYAPQVFREIRRSFGVDDDSFKSSLGIKQVLGSFLMGDLTGLSELVSEGKSGSFFYFSSDNRFLVKTISTAESRTLRRILPDYLDHFQKNNHTLLSRIFGLYKLKMDDTTSVFVIMGNVFNPTVPIHQRYDLKGSTHGRTVGEAHLHEKGVVLKDLDFIKLGRKINVGPNLKAPLVAQIRRDSDFLTAHGIIDYSLLIGIHRSDRAPQVYPLDSRPETPVTPTTPIDETSPPPMSTLPAESVLSSGGSDPTIEMSFSASEGSASAIEPVGSMVRSPSGSMPSLAASPAAAPPLGASNSRSTGSLYKSTTRKPRSFSKLLGIRRDSQATVRARYTEVDDAQLPSGVSMFQIQQGGALSERVVEADHTVVVGEEILYIGIIDILIPYETYKQGEHLIKSIVSDGKQISVVPPEEYGPRFQKFVCDAIC